MDELHEFLQEVYKLPKGTIITKEVLIAILRRAEHNIEKKEDENHLDFSDLNS